MKHFYKSGYPPVKHDAPKMPEPPTMRVINLEEITPVMIGHMPSAKGKCARISCRAEMTCRPVEHMLVFECPACGYECRETSSGMRADFELAQGRRR